MKAKFGYTGLRVRNLDEGIKFFTELLGMQVKARVKAPWNKGEFANLITGNGKHWLELNWYADDSPVGGPFREGDELDHLGFEVDDFEGTLKRLNEAGYPTLIGPISAEQSGDWDIAFVKGIDGIWLDIYHIPIRHKKKPSKTRRKRSK